jgi:hypothetical protein
MTLCTQYCKNNVELWGVHAQDYVSVLSHVLQVKCTMLVVYPLPTGADEQTLFVRKFDDEAGPRVHVLVYDGHAEVLQTDAAVKINFDTTFYNVPADW